MKIVRVIVTTLLITGLAVLQGPAPAQCQMGLGLPAAMCSMPCCRTHPLSAPARCPMMRQAAPRDTITLSSLKIVPVLSVICSEVSSRIKAPLVQWTFFRPSLQSIKSLFAIAPPLIRAPPADSFLVEA